jgi:hypothetical protein
MRITARSVVLRRDSANVDSLGSTSKVSCLRRVKASPLLPERFRSALSHRPRSRHCSKRTPHLSRRSLHCSPLPSVRQRLPWPNTWTLIARMPRSTLRRTKCVGSQKKAKTGNRSHRNSTASFISPLDKADIVPLSNLVDEIESIPKITARRKEVLDPSPVLEKSQPVKSILSNMRVQRMSLCQSLRQYLFVYRGK